MILIIISLIIVSIIVYMCLPANKPEKFEINYDVHQDTNIHKLDLQTSQTDLERDMIGDFNNNFFNFQNHIWHNSHLTDSVDNMNATNNANNYDIGNTIAAVYDDVVNSRNYKTNNTVSCNQNIEPM